MAATILMGSRSELVSSVIDSMHHFRHDVFVKRLGWNIPSEDGQEKDSYDTAETKYVVVRDSLGAVTATARLLPTTASYMLPELFPQLLGSMSAPRDPQVWELSRFATTVCETREGGILSLSARTMRLLEAVFDLARQHRIKRLILVTSIGIERLMLRTGLAVHRMGPPATVDGRLAVAVFIEVPPAETTLRSSANRQPYVFGMDELDA